MSDAFVIRISSLPKLRACISSRALSDEARVQLAIPGNVSGDAGALGTAYHALVERFRTGESISIEDVKGTAVEYMVPYEELRQLWARIPQVKLEGAEIEVVEEAYEWILCGNPLIVLSGHPDWVRYWPEKKLLRVDDWKTGRFVEEAENQAQIRAYVAFIANSMMTDPYDPVEIERAEGALWAIRTGEVSTVSFTKEQIEDEVSRVTTLCLRAHAVGGLPVTEREYRTGSYCQWCDGRPLCPARRAEAYEALRIATGVEESVDVSSVAVVKGGPRKGLPNLKELDAARNEAMRGRVHQMVTQDAAAAWKARRLAGWLYGALSDGLRDHLDFFGSVPLEEGRELQLSGADMPVPLTKELVAQALAYCGVSEEVASQVVAHLEARPKNKVYRMIGKNVDR